jgi:hypothetical protein
LESNSSNSTTDYTDFTDQEEVFEARSLAAVLLLIPIREIRAIRGRLFPELFNGMTNGVAAAMANRPWPIAIEIWRSSRFCSSPPPQIPEQKSDRNSERTYSF